MSDQAVTAETESNAVASATEEVPRAASGEGSTRVTTSSRRANATNGRYASPGTADSDQLLRCSHELTTEQRELIERLRCSLKPEFGDRDVDKYLDDEDMLRRYLKGHGWNFDTARRYLAKSLAFREKKPRPASWTCSYCVDNPGYHCMRQVGSGTCTGHTYIDIVCMSQYPVHMVHDH